MKKALSLFLVVLMVGGVFFTGCTGSGDNGLDMVSSYMADDSTVVVKFRNETGKTISDVSGSLNLFWRFFKQPNSAKIPLLYMDWHL